MLKIIVLAGQIFLFHVWFEKGLRANTNQADENRTTSLIFVTQKAMGNFLSQIQNIKKTHISLFLSL